jgi:hypothetical protein
MAVAQHDLQTLTQCAVKAYYGVEDIDICSAHGINQSTLERWRTTPEWTAASVESADAQPEVLAAMARGVIKGALEGHCAVTARWVLERRDKTFAQPDKRSQIDVKVSHDTAMQHLDIMQLRRLEHVIMTDPEQAQRLLMSPAVDVIDVEFEDVPDADKQHA